MLKITPYLGMLVIFVSVFGFMYPLLGYVIPLTIAAMLLMAPLRGRWFCGNLCPRGSFVDFWISRKTKSLKIPEILKSYWIRIPVFFILAGLMIKQLLLTEGLINQAGMVLVIRYALATAITAILGITISPRTWCTFCPLGTIQRILGGKKYPLNINEHSCIQCKKCDRACPMQLEVSSLEQKPDCIKCERCIVSCPKDALWF